MIYFYELIDCKKDKSELLISGLMRSMENIIKGVDQSLSSQEEQLALKESSLDQLRTSYQTLVDEQRAYYTAIKDFQAECDKNEWLMDAMEKKKQGTL